MSFLRVSHLFTCTPRRNLAIHHHPVKPDKRVAYQAFRQLGRLIVLLKHPPASHLLPPTPKPTGVGAYRPPPVCNSSAVHAARAFPEHTHDLTILLEATLSSLFPHLAEMIFSK